MWPTSPTTSVVVDKDGLTISYPESQFFNEPKSDRMVLHFGALPFFSLNTKSFADGKVSFPGLDVELSGNVMDEGRLVVDFSKRNKLHGAWFYRVTIEFPKTLQTPTLRVAVKKTAAPVCPLYV